MKNQYFCHDDQFIEISLTQNQSTIIDQDDMLLISTHRWYALRCRNTYYAVTNIKKSDGTRTLLLMHRLILGPQNTGSKEIDHIDGNGLNNLRINLRFVSVAGNQHNQHIKQTGRHNKQPTSKFPGVYWHKRMRKWAAKIRLFGKNIHLGYYDDEQKAANRYLSAKSLRESCVSVVQFVDML